ncbi:MAG: type II/IV secretion system ATPase subunit [Candidatus Nezhaarchaeales archaeon]
MGLFGLKEPFSSSSRERVKGREGADAFPEVKIKVWKFEDVRKIRVIRSYNIDRFVNIIIGEEITSPRRLYIVCDPSVTEGELRELEKRAMELIYVLEGVPTEEALIKYLEDGGLRRPELQYLIIRELAFDRFGALDPLMRDPSLENIECTGPYRPVTVLHSELGRLETNLVFTEEELDKLVMKLANKAGKSISKANPRIDNARLPGGHRLACTFMSEISEHSSFVIRKFPSEPWTITRHMLSGTLTPEIGAWLWLLVEHKLPILIVGGMGTGKTSLANSLCGFIPPDKRVGTVEDVPEFNLPVKKQNWQRMFTRESYSIDGKGSIDLFALVKEMLRYQVEYLIVNEIRGEEAKVWFQQISSGHGGITTIHADDFTSALVRLKDLGIEIASLNSLHGLVYIAVYTKDGKRVRRIREVADFELVDGKPVFRVLFRYNPSNDTYESVPPEELAKTRSAAKIINISDKIHNENELINEYKRRIEFLRWLLEKAKNDQSYTKLNILINLFEKFYRDPLFFYKELETPMDVQRKEKPYIKIVEIKKMKQDIKIVNLKQSIPQPGMIVKAKRQRKPRKLFKIRGDNK